MLNLFQFQPQQLILMLGLACLGAFWLARMINAHLTPVRTSDDAPSNSHKNPQRELVAVFKNIIGSKLMIYMSLGLMLFVIGNKLLEYHYQTIIYYEVFPDSTQRATFFATYELFANLAWLFIQLLLTPRLLVKLGVGASNVLYPVLSAIVALALLIYFYSNAQILFTNSVAVMLGLGIVTQFINQEMRGALRTPVNNLLFNAIQPNQWGNGFSQWHCVSAVNCHRWDFLNDNNGDGCQLFNSKLGIITRTTPLSVALDCPDSINIRDFNRLATTVTI